MFNLDGLVPASMVKSIAADLDPRMDTDGFNHARRHNIYFRQSVDGVSEDHPALAQFDTVNHTLCADQMASSDLIRIYEHPGLIDFLARVMGKERLFTMDDPLARVNVMRYGDGEGLNWHFDRSEFTTTLLLQSPFHGGLFQYARDLRSDDDPNLEGVAKLIQGEWPVENVRLWPGTLNVFLGKNTAHRVTPVSGTQSRMIAVFSFYEVPGKVFSEQERIGFYGRAS